MGSSDPSVEVSGAISEERPGGRVTDSTALFVAATVAAEALLALGALTAGMVVEMLLIVALAQLSVFGGLDARTPEGNRITSAMLIVPLLRLATIVMIPADLPYPARLALSAVAAVAVVIALTAGMRLPDLGLRAIWGRQKARRAEHIAFVSTAFPISLGLHGAVVQSGTEPLYGEVGAGLIPLVVGAVLVEEYVFRGFIQGQLKAAGVARGAWLVGILYVSTYLWWASPVMISWAAAAAALFGWYRRETGSVWAVACNHALTVLFATFIWPALIT